MFKLLQLDQAVLGVPDRKYLLNNTKDKVGKAYLKTIIQTAKALSPSSEIDLIQQDAKNLVNFEAKLAKVSNFKIKNPFIKLAIFFSYYFQMKIDATLLNCIISCH